MDQGKRKTNEAEVPLKLNDHAMDAARYASLSLKKLHSGRFHSSFHKV